jgi:hypothetical protein
MNSGAFSGFRLDPDLSLVQINHIFDNSHAKAQALALMPGTRAPEVFVKHLFLFLLCHTMAIVRNSDMIMAAVFTPAMDGYC